MGSKIGHIIRKFIYKPIGPDKLLLLLGLIVFSHGEVNAQQDPMYTQYMNNILSINPAYASVGENIEMNLITRNQWVGIEGAPVTQSFSALMPLKNVYAGLGMSFISDKIGPVKQTGAYVDYSFKIRLAYRTYLAFGLKGGGNFFNTDYAILKANDSADPIWSEEVTRKFLPNFGIGVFFYSDRVFAGLSIPKLMENQIQDIGYSSQFASREEMHFFGIAGYVFDLNRDVKFKPYTLVKFVSNSPVSVDVSAHFLFYDRLWAGANWRVGDAVGAMMQVFITSQLKVGYAYDVTATDLNSFNRGTHEILVNFVLNSGRRKFMSPRYF